MNKVINDKHSVIFYGAGAEAERRLSQWIDEGLTPVCFADADKNKHYTTLGGVEILPLEEAIRRYEDYILYMTVAQGNMRTVREHLAAKGIPTDRITTIEPYEWRKGCYRLGKYIGWDGAANLIDTTFKACCMHGYDMPGYAKVFVSTGDIETDCLTYKQYCDETIEKWRNEEPTQCDGCPLLYYDYWETEPKITHININTGRGDYCNFRCSYCHTSDWSNSFFKNVMNEDHKERYSYIKSLLQYAHNSFPNAVILWNAGEITISPYCDEVVDYWRENSMQVVISSNAFIYKESIADYLCKCGAYLHVSPDAGTSDTFAKIKGINGFEKVTDNLIRYYDNGGKLILKYILLDGINDNKEDITGFLDICKRTNAIVYLARTYSARTKPLPQYLLDLCMFFIDECYARGLMPLRARSEHHHPCDKDKLDRQICRLWGYAVCE